MSLAIIVRCTMLLVFSLGLALNTTFAAEQVSEQKKQLIDTLLQQTTQTNQDISTLLIEEYLRQIKQIIKQSQPDISPTKLKKVEDEVTAIVKQEIVEQAQFSQLVYPLYDRYLTSDDLQKMIEFNNTELGKKLLRVMPLIALESKEVTTELELDLAPQINERLLDILKNTHPN